MIRNTDSSAAQAVLDHGRVQLGAGYRIFASAEPPADHIRVRPDAKEG